MKTYRIKYKGTRGGNDIFTADFQTSGPVMALNYFHRDMQLNRGYKQSDYEVVSVVHRYSSDPQGRPEFPMVESEFDLPKTPNPVLIKDETPVIETSTMPFYDEVASPKPDAGV